MRPTDIFFKTLRAIKRAATLIINYGGSRSSKTFSIIQLLVMIAEQKAGMEIIMVAATIPKLKKTLLKDFIEIVDFNPMRYNKQDHKYVFPNGSFIQFMSAENPNDFIGVKCHYAFLDEVNTYRYGKDIYLHLEIRNSMAILVAFNPSAKFWIEDYWDLEGTEVIHSTYKDNLENVPKKIIKSLEDKAKTDVNFYKVYTLGQWGSLEGLVFTEGVNWEVTNHWPQEYKWRIWGMDFGFSNDPTCLVELRYWDGNVYAKTLIYESGLFNQDIINKLKDLKVSGPIIADKSNPQAIAEIARARIRILPSAGGPDSVIYGTTQMKDVHLMVHNTSIDMIRELRGYSYLLSPEGKPVNKVNKAAHLDHAIDPSRYALEYKLGGKGSGIKVGGVIRK